MQLTPEEAKLLKPSGFTVLLLVVGTSLTVLSKAVLEGFLCGLLASAIVGFCAWLAGARDPREVALMAGGFFGALAAAVVFIAAMMQWWDNYKALRLKALADEEPDESRFRSKRANALMDRLEGRRD